MEDLFGRAAGMTIHEAAFPLSDADDETILVIVMRRAPGR
jgi:hypothetical protein